MEALETRTLLTATLYLDFGDNFAGANGLTTDGVTAVTEADFTGTVNGPDFGGVAGTDTLTFTTFAAEAAIFGLTPAQTATMRASIISLVQRYYAVFDVNIVVVGAATLPDIQASLASTGTSDCYLLLGGITANPGAINGGLNGQAGGNEFNTFVNTTDDTAVVLANNLFTNGSATLVRGDTAFAYTAAHEAAHTYGLEHTVNAFAASNDTRRLTNSDMISQFYNTGIDADQRGTFNFFTRFSLPRAHNAGSYVPYDRLAANVGLKGAAPAYITGTGAFDLITITRVDATTANVTVQAHRDNSFANQIDAFPTYIVNYTNGLLIEGGLNQDRIVLDGNIAANITVRGMGNAADELVVNGLSAASGMYIPAGTQTPGLDNNNDFRGQITIAGGSTINFEEFQTTGSVTVQNVGIFTFRTPNSADTLSMDSPAGSQAQIAGNSGGVAFVPLIVSGVADLVVDTATNDGAGTGEDAVSVSMTSSPSASLVINTGAGGDTVTVNNLGAGFAVPLQVNGDGGIDTLEVFNTTVTYTPDGTNLPSQGTLNAYSGETIQFTDFEFVTPVAPEITSFSVDLAVINEGDSVTLSLDFIDPGSLSSHSVTVEWETGVSETIDLVVGERSFTRVHTYLDDNPTGTPSDVHTIQVTVTDNDTLTDSDSTLITVNNVDPVITSTDNSASSTVKAEEGEIVTISGTFTDVGTLDTHDVSLDWGDGTVEPGTVNQGAGSGDFTGGHAYTSGGIFTVTITLTDDDTGFDTAIETVFITGAGVQTIDGKQVLFIVGSNDGDLVHVNQQGDGTITVQAGFLDGGERSFSEPIDEIRMYLCGGDDKATIASSVQMPALIDGGIGNDQLNAGAGPAVLIGGLGADVLTGGKLNDLLLGGDGGDRLVGNSGQDILIGGLTTYDFNGDDNVLGNQAKLLSILAEWNSTRSLEERHDNIAGTGVGPRLNGNNFMQHGVTVLDDGDIDKLTGSSGIDWFFLFAGDVATDYDDGDDFLN